jgi:hypothetical protein
VAASLCAQPDGGGDRGVSLGNYWRRGLDQPAGFWLIDGDRAAVAGHRDSPVPAHGEAVCGCDLSANAPAWQG